MAFPRYDVEQLPRHDVADDGRAEQAVRELFAVWMDVAVQQQRRLQPGHQPVQPAEPDVWRVVPVTDAERRRVRDEDVDRLLRPVSPPAFGHREPRGASRELTVRVLVRAVAVPPATAESGQS